MDLACRHIPVTSPGAASQRNLGAESVQTPLVAFIDDDVILKPDMFAELVQVFAQDDQARVGGVSARIEGLSHSPPGTLTRWYYRLQAGYDHPDYGGKLFGPAINCLPCYRDDQPALIEADWLNAGGTMYRTELFLREKFPDFPGYSHMEDVHLSARIGRTHKLFFHRYAAYQHLDETGDWKKDVIALTRLKWKNQKKVAREILGLSGWPLLWKFFLHRLFVTFSILKNGSRGRWREIRGIWTSFAE